MPAQPTTARSRSGPFGICAAIGADFDFNPEILRVALAAGVLWNTLAMVGLYAFAGLLMLIGRALFPDRKAKADTAVRLSVNDGDRIPAMEERLAA